MINTLEAMDLMVHPRKEEVVGAHGDEEVHLMVVPGTLNWVEEEHGFTRIKHGLHGLELGGKMVPGTVFRAAPQSGARHHFHCILPIVDKITKKWHLFNMRIEICTSKLPPGTVTVCKSKSTSIFFSSKCRIIKGVFVW